ncbi:EutP/PduV family microcompartment system protein [Aneurinibacillus terranovensis]|uniref:EutP/PduV family microcompartment system protein n=1 Tax=Aneurinibacillus terranovensis TaxID=278991 RepID=UPI000408B9C9|nr:EutP/PduV family microcompartment system protein [Aneurinibacillus terranovensis]
MNKKHRAMLIGAIGSGKSTMTHALLGRKTEAVKTQSLIYYDWIVDTPGEYTENPLFYKSIMATSLEVTHVLFIQDATRQKTIFPPGFATGIPKLIIGVITKSESPQADIDRATTLLQYAMPRGPIVAASAFTGQGIEDIRRLVACRSLHEMREYCQKTKSEYVFLS